MGTVHGVARSRPRLSKQHYHYSDVMDVRREFLLGVLSDLLIISTNRAHVPNGFYQ